MTTALLIPLLVASYVPSVLPSVPVALDGSYEILACSTSYFASDGTTDTVVSLPPAASCTGQSLFISDPYGLCSDVWVSIAPYGSESITGFSSAQRIILPRAGVSVSLTSDGSGWSCSKGSGSCVVDPRSVSGLVGWWDSMHGVSKDATSGRVTAWADQSGNGFDLAEVSSSGPLISTGGGLLAFTFNGVNNYLRSSTTQQLASTTITLAAVYADSASDTRARAVFATDYSATTGVALVNDSSAAQRTILDGRWASASVTFTAETLSLGMRAPLSKATNIRSVVGRVGVTSDIYVDGATDAELNSTTATAAQPTMTDGYWYVGQSHYGNSDGGWFQGLLQALMVLDSSVSDDDLARIREFVRRRHF